MARMQQLITEAQAMTLADGVTTLNLPPPTYGVVPSWWSRSDGSVYPRFDLEIWASGTLQLTAAELFGAAPHPIEISDDTFAATGVGAKSELDLAPLTAVLETVVRAKVLGVIGDDITLALVGDGTTTGQLNETAYPAIVFHFAPGVTTVGNFETAIGAATYLEIKTLDGTPATVLTAPADDFAATHLAGGVNETLTAALHGNYTGDGPFRLTTSGTLPGGEALATDYWFIRLGANTFQWAASRSDALDGIPVLPTSAGTGVQTLHDTADTERLYWHSHGLLGPAGDGVIDLDAQTAYLFRDRHNPRAIMYALRATFGAAVAVSALMFPSADKE